MDGLRAWLTVRDVVPIAAAVGLSAVLASTAGVLAAEPIVFGLVGATLVVFAVALLAYHPHVGVVLLVSVFALLPLADDLVSPSVGPLKDVLVAAALLATGLRLVLGQPLRADGLTVALALLILLAYALNIGGAIDGTALSAGWAHGTRLVAEPLVLLLYGLTVVDPRRTFRWLLGSVVVAAVVVAAYGLLQQAIGPQRLVALGYQWDIDVRTIDGRLRSFGTLDDPFLYAAFLFFGVAMLLLGTRRRFWTPLLLALLLAGIAVSYVRTAALLAAALVGLLLIRIGRSGLAVLLLLAALAAAITLSLQITQSAERRVVTSDGGVLTLNERTKAWRAAVGSWQDVPFGQGVGAIGTAAQRAMAVPLYGSAPVERSIAVDSTYFATLADVGLVGLALVILLYLRLGLVAARCARRGAGEAWVALGALAVFALDGVTRASNTGFPTAFLAMLVIGISIAAARSHLGLQDTRRGSDGSPGRA